MILTEICQEIRNWFDRNQSKYYGKITISGGVLGVEDDSFGLQAGQYYRIIGSLFNDGVHKYDESDPLTDENTFEGAVWSMAIPPAVVSLAKDIEDWQAKYGGVDSQAMSPFNSESFGGYSYSKSGGGSGASSANGGAGTWQGVFAKRLNAWRKIL